MDNELFFLRLDDLSSRISANDLRYGLTFFTEDAENDTKYTEQFWKFQFKVGRDGKDKYGQTIHSIVQKYLFTMTNKGTESTDTLAKCYLLEAIYYLGVNVYSESIRNIHCVMDLPKVSANLVVTALSIMETLLFESHMYENAKQYLTIIEKLERSGKLSTPYRFTADVGLMHSFAMIGDEGKARDYMQRALDTPEAEVGEGRLRTLNLYCLSMSALLSAGTDPSKEYLELLDDALSQMDGREEMQDSLTSVLIPILHYVQDSVTDEELVKLVLNMVKLCVSVTDRLSLYGFLVEDAGVDDKYFKDIYDEYFLLLRRYYHDEKLNRRQIIENALAARELEKNYQMSAKTDKLTLLGNRQAYDDRIDELTRKKGSLPNNIAIVMMDLNGLKEQNDTYGHEAGDELIVGAASCAKASFGDLGKVFRIGGDEFVAVVTAEPETVKRRSIMLEQEMKVWRGKYTSGVSMSYGYATGSEMPHDALTEKARLKALLQLADARMYEAKTHYYETNGIDRRKKKRDTECGILSLETETSKQ